MMQKKQWTKMTWQEIQSARKDNPTVIIPLGTVETQGKFNVVGLETIIVERLAEEVAARTDSLYLPAVPFGYSDLFANIPGTVSIRPEVLDGLYEDIFRAVVKAGFDHLLFLTAHVPNQPVLQRVFFKMREELGILGVSLNPGRIAPGFIADLFENPIEVRGHGAEPGLSLGRYLCPDEVTGSDEKPDDLASDFRGIDLDGMTPKHEGFEVLMALTMKDVAPETFGFGDPTASSREKGE